MNKQQTQKPKFLRHVIYAAEGQNRKIMK